MVYRVEFGWVHCYLLFYIVQDEFRYFDDSLENSVIGRRLPTVPIKW